MNITFNPINNNRNNYRFNNLSFQAMKKSQFKGIDRFIVERHKAPIEKFNVLDDLYKFCKEKVEQIKNKDFGGRQQETQIQRKAMLKEWSEYVTVKNAAYTLPIQLMILAGISDKLKQNEDTLPPVLNRGVLADTVTEIENELNNNPTAQVNFEKEYKNNLQKTIFEEEKVLDESLNGWIVIPSKKHDRKNFEKNVDKLKTLSHNNWCTKSYNAKPYLAEGDFHVYMEQGKPKLGVRFVGKKIEEIQGEKNNGKIPVRYYDVAKEHIKGIKLSENANNELEQAKQVKVKVDKIKEKFPNGIENATTEEILKELNIPYKKDEKDGLYTLESFKEPNDDFTYSDLGINENKIFKDIKAIEGDADFRFSELTNLGNLKSIGGKAVFKHSLITDLGNLKSIGGDADFWGSQITSLGKLQSIGGDAYFRRSRITDLGNLQSIGGNADFRNSNIRDFGNLESINGNPISEKLKAPNALLNDCLKDATIPEIFDTLHIKYRQDENGLYTISHYTDFYKIPYNKFGVDEDKLFKVIKAIEGDADFRCSKHTSLGNLESIGGKAYFGGSQIISLGKLKSIGGDADFWGSQITSLGKLQSIGGCADFSNSQITDLGKLQSIGVSAMFGESKITNLGNLESIGGKAYFGGSQITNLGNLKSIGRDAYYDNVEFANLIKPYVKGKIFCLKA